jgi:hypothetical protein
VPDRPQSTGAGPDQRPLGQSTCEIAATQHPGSAAHAVAEPREVRNRHQYLVGEGLRALDQEPCATAVKEIHATIMARATRSTKRSGA